MVESELERAEKRIDDLSFENKKLKDEIRTYSNELKSFEAADEQYTERETQVGYFLNFNFSQKINFLKFFLKFFSSKLNFSDGTTNRFSLGAK